MSQEEITEIKELLREHSDQLQPCIQKVEEMHTFLLGNLKNEGYVSRNERRLDKLEVAECERKKWGQLAIGAALTSAVSAIAAWVTKLGN